MEGDKEPRRTFKTYPIGFFHIDIAEVQTAQGKLYLFVAVDRACKFAVAQLVDKANTQTARTKARLDEGGIGHCQRVLCGQVLMDSIGCLALRLEERKLDNELARAADCSGPRLVREGRKLGSLRFEAALTVGARSAEDDGARETAATAFALLLASRSIFAFRSGSRSSSAAMPARAKRA
jgi:hypothetical protein